VLSRNPLQFAVVREDPAVEKAVVEEFGCEKLLLIGSGGCTALALRGWFPDAALTLVDPNVAQLRHIETKLRVLAAPGGPERDAAFNIGTAEPAALHECGNFESLFRLFRQTLDLFILPQVEWEERLEAGARDWDDVFAHPYWPVAFDLAFGDSLLTEMFGPEAVQHAPRGSYPGYFRERLEAALQAPDLATNPYVHHVFLGKYLHNPEAWPAFLREPPRDLDPFDCHAVGLADVEDFGAFDFVHISNVLDWMDAGSCHNLAHRLARELAPGACVLWRQLNDPRDLVGLFAPTFRFDGARDARLLALERAAFYDQVHLGVHQ